MLQSLQSLLPGDGLDADDIEMLLILGAAFMPSVIGLMLAVVSLRLPDDGYALSQLLDDRREHKRANDDDRDWRRAA